MSIPARPQNVNSTRLLYAPARMPSRRVEYAYYFALIYSVMAGVLGISVGLLGGGMILALSAYCILQLRSCAKAVYGPIGLLLACATSFVLIQTAIHGESIIEDYIRSFIVGFLGLIIIQSLYLRPGFLHRFTIVLFALGLVTLPFLTFTEVGVERARVEIAGVGGGLGHPYGLAGWFGFCAVYFAIFGLERKRGIVQIAWWVVAVGCLFIIALTVSRGVLFSSGMAITVGFRRLLKRGFVPLFLILLMTLVIYESGLFAHVFSYYIERGMEETGREIIWPASIERILTSPLVGVGISNFGMYAEGGFSKLLLATHNSFLQLALSSGVVPVAFFVAFWIRAAWGCFSAVERQEHAPFRIPFLLYIFVGMMLNDLLLVPWSLVALSVVAGSGVAYRTDRLLLVNRIGDRQTARLLGRRSEAAKATSRYRF